MEQQTSQPTEVESLPLDFGPVVTPVTPNGTPDPAAILGWLQNALAPKAPAGPSVEEIARRVVREELKAFSGWLGLVITKSAYTPEGFPENVGGEHRVAAINEAETLKLVPIAPQTVKRGVGRPKGSTNKPKVTVEAKPTSKKRNGASSLLAVPDGLRKGQLTIGMAAHQFKVDAKDLYQATKNGEVEKFQVPGKGRGVRNGLIWVVRESEVKRWIDKR